MLLSVILDADLERTRQARARERAEMAAESDPLTGLFNRRDWDRYMANEESRSRRFGDPGAVVVIELDSLKAVNATLGQAAGHELIKAAGRVLLDTVSGSDIVARLGGGEFGVIASKVVPEQCEHLVDRIVTGFEQAGVSGSIGHLPYTIAAGFLGAFADAGAAMYEQKLRRQAYAIAS